MHTVSHNLRMTLPPNVQYSDKSLCDVFLFGLYFSSALSSKKTALQKFSTAWLILDGHVHV